jgi:hypothetical protein
MSYQKALAMRKNADNTGGKSNAIRSQTISGVNDVSSLVAFHDTPGRKGEVLFSYSARTPHGTFFKRP